MTLLLLPQQQLLEEMRQRDYDFYNVALLDKCFKRVLAAVSAVRGYPPGTSQTGTIQTGPIDDQGGKRGGR
jgi:hypothetical protein